MTYTNPNAVARYAESFARRACDEFFDQQPVVSGKEIISFTNVPQVNYFVLFQLFNNWQQEASRLESPYFDYTQDEVKAAMEQLMNTLSRHIRVERPAFEPLAAQATAMSLRLLLDPRTALTDLLHTLAAKPLTLQRLADQTRFIRTNRSVWETMLEQLRTDHASPEDEIPVGKAIAVLEDILAAPDTMLEEAGNHLEAYSAYVPLSLEELQTPDPEPKPALEPVQEAPPAATKSFFDSLPDDVPPPPKRFKKETTSEEPPAEQTPESPVIKPEDVKVDIEQFVKAANKPLMSVLSEKKKAEEVTLNDALSRDQQTLNEALRKDEESTFIEKAQNQRISSIREALNLNQKYYFVNGLFGGDNVAFAQAVHDLEQAPDLHSAMRLLEIKYAHTLGWDLQGEEYLSFVDVIERKFM